MRTLLLNWPVFTPSNYVLCLFVTSQNTSSMYFVLQNGLFPPIQKECNVASVINLIAWVPERILGHRTGSRDESPSPWCESFSVAAVCERGLRDGGEEEAHHHCTASSDLSRHRQAHPLTPFPCPSWGLPSSFLSIPCALWSPASSF